MLRKITLKINISDTRARETNAEVAANDDLDILPAPYVFDSTLSLQSTGVQVLILKHILSQLVEFEAYENEGACEVPISWQDGPYFDKKTKYVLYKYQTLNREHIISFIKSNKRATTDEITNQESETKFVGDLGIMSLATIACMHGYRKPSSQPGETPSSYRFTNHSFTVDSDSDDSDIEKSQLFKSTEHILNLINDFTLGIYPDELGRNESPTEAASRYDATSRSKAGDWFSKPDPNIIGRADIAAGLEDEPFDIGLDKIGLYLPTEYDLRNPPVLTESNWKEYVREVAEEATEKILLFNGIDITKQSILRLFFNDETFFGLYPNFNNYKKIPNNVEYYIYPKDEDYEEHFVIDMSNIDANSDLFVDPTNRSHFFLQGIQFLEESTSGEEYLPLVEYTGFTTPSFRPGAIYKNEFIFSRKKIEMIKNAWQDLTPAPSPPQQSRSESMEQNIENRKQEELDRVEGSPYPDLERSLSDDCIEGKVNDYFNEVGAINAVVSMTRGELNENVNRVISDAKDSILRHDAVDSEKERKDSSLEDQIRNRQAQGADEGSMGSFGMNDSAAMLNPSMPMYEPKKPKDYKPGLINGTLSDIRSRIKKVSKLLKDASKELEELESSLPDKTLVPDMDLKKEAKYMDEALVYFEDLANAATDQAAIDEAMQIIDTGYTEEERRSIVETLSSDPDEIYFEFETEMSNKKQGYLKVVDMGDQPTMYYNKDKQLLVDSTVLHAWNYNRLNKIMDFFYRPSYTIGYLADMFGMIWESRSAALKLGGCFTFMKSAASVALIIKYTIPRPAIEPKIGETDWPPFSGPFKTATNQAADQSLAYVLSFEKAVLDWKKSALRSLDARPPLPDFSKEFNAVCNLEKLYQKFLDKLNIGNLICQVLKCMGLWPIGIDFNLSFILPKMPKMPTFDILKYLHVIIYKAIIQTLAKVLCNVAQTILDLLKLDCRGPDISLGDRADYPVSRVQHPSPGPVPGLGQAIQELAIAAARVGLPETLYDSPNHPAGSPLHGTGGAKQFVEDLSHLLSPSEQCALYRGDGSLTALGLAMNLIKRSYSNSDSPSLSDYFDTDEEIMTFFAKLGIAGASEACNLIDDVLDQAGPEGIPELDKPDDCLCIDGESLRDKFLRSQFANYYASDPDPAGSDGSPRSRGRPSQDEANEFMGDVTAAMAREALDRANKKRADVKKAFEELASGELISKVPEELADFSNPSSPLFDIPGSFKSLLKTAIDGTLEPIKSEYYEDIRKYVPFMHQEITTVHADSQLATGANQALERKKIATIETLRNYNFWLSIVRPTDFDLSEIDPKNIDLLYSFYCLLYPIYKERYLARYSNDRTHYMRHDLFGKEKLEDAFESLRVGVDVSGNPLEAVEKVERVLELYPSPYPRKTGYRPPQAYDRVEKEYEASTWKNFIINTDAAQTYNRAISSKTVRPMRKALEKVSGRLRGKPSAQLSFPPVIRGATPGRASDYSGWMLTDSVRTVQMFAFQDPRSEIIRFEGLPANQTTFRAPIITGFSPPDLTAMHAGDKHKGKKLPAGFTKTFSLETFIEGDLDESDLLKSEILKKIADRLQELIDEITNVFSLQQAGGSAGSATQQVTEFLPKVKPLFQKELEISRESDDQSREIIYTSSSPDSKARIELRSPPTLSDIGEQLISRLQSDDEDIVNLREKISKQLEGKMRFESYYSQDYRNINTSFHVIKDPHYLRNVDVNNVDSDNHEKTIFAENCKLIPVSLISDNELDSIYFNENIDFDGREYPNAVGLYTGMIVNGAWDLFRKHDIDIRERTEPGTGKDPYSWISDTYDEAVEFYFEDVFDQVFDSPFISDENYIEIIKKKLTGVPYTKEEEDDSGCNLERTGYEPVKILIDFEREIEAALSRVISRLRTPNSLRNHDFRKPSPFEEGIIDTVVLLFVKVLMYEFALRAGPAMSAFKAKDLLNHQFIVNFVVEWILKHEIENLRVFRSNPELKTRFLEAVTKTTGQETVEEGLRLIIREEMPDVGTRVDKLFDSFIENSSSAFMARLPYGSVFNLSSIKRARVDSSSAGLQEEFESEISSGVKYFDLSINQPENSSEQYTSMSEDLVAEEDQPGRAAQTNFVEDLKNKGGYILESYVKLNGEIARQFKEIALTFEGLQEELNKIEDAELARDDQADVNVVQNQQRLAKHITDTENEVIVSIQEFRDFMQGTVIDPIMENLGLDLDQLGFSENCNGRPKFVNKYPHTLVSLDRKHTVLDSRHINWMNSLDNHVQQNYLIDPESFELEDARLQSRVTKLSSLVGSVHPMDEATQGASGFKPRRYLMYPVDMCPYISTSNREEDVVSAIMTSANANATDAEVHGNDEDNSYYQLERSVHPDTRNYNYKFNFFANPINTRTNSKSKEGYAFTAPKEINTRNLIPISEDEMIWNPGTSGDIIAKNGVMSDEKIVENMPFQLEEEDLGDFKKVIQRVRVNRPNMLQLNSKIGASDEEYLEDLEDLGYSLNNAGSPFENALAGNYEISAAKFNEIKSENSNTYQQWTQYVVDVIGFAAPMLDVGETFHASSDLPSIEQHEKEVIKTADGFQFWKRYLSTPSTEIQQAQTFKGVQETGNIYTLSSFLVENQKKYTHFPDRHGLARLHPDGVLARGMHPVEYTRWLLQGSAGDNQERMFSGLFGPSLAQQTLAMQRPFFGSGHPSWDIHTETNRSNNPVIKVDELATKMFMFHHNSLENVSTGYLRSFYGLSEIEENIMPEDIFVYYGEMDNTLSNTLADPAAAFFMATFDYKLKQSEDDTGAPTGQPPVREIKMSRPLGVTPVFFSSGEENWAQPTADQSWFELRAYTPDLHFDFPWTYINMSSSGHKSYSDDHLFNSCLKVVYTDEEKSIINRHKRYYVPSSRSMRKNGGDYGTSINDPIHDKFLKWRQYFNRVDPMSYKDYADDASARDLPLPLRTPGSYYWPDTALSHRPGVQGSKQRLDLTSLFGTWRNNLYDHSTAYGQLYSDAGRKIKNHVRDAEGSFYNYSLSRLDKWSNGKSNTSRNWKSKIREEYRQFSVSDQVDDRTPGADGGPAVGINMTIAWNLKDARQILQRYDWSLHNIFNFDPVGVHSLSMNAPTSCANRTGGEGYSAYAEMASRDLRWHSGRITNGDLGHYMYIPYTNDYSLSRGAYNAVRASILATEKKPAGLHLSHYRSGERQSFGLMNLSYNQILYPIPLSGSILGNLTYVDGYSLREDGNHNRRQKPGRYFKIPYRRIQPAQFISPIRRKISTSDLYYDSETFQIMHRYTNWMNTKLDEYSRSEGWNNQSEVLADILYKKERAQKHSAKHKLPPLHFFQKNLVKNHYHSPNQVRCPLRLFFTRVDYFIGNRKEASKVFFAYDIPHTLKGAKTEYNEALVRLEPVHSPYRKKMLQAGLRKAAYEYLDYSKLERFAMRMPNNGSNIYKLLDKETSNALSMTWYLPHPGLMNENPNKWAFRNFSQPTLAGTVGILGRWKMRKTHPHGRKPSPGFYDSVTNYASSVNATQTISTHPPVMNPSLVNYNISAATTPIGGANSLVFPENVTKVKKTSKPDTGLYFLDRVSKALHGELLSWNHNPALPEGYGEPDLAGKLSRRSQDRNSAGTYQHSNQLNQHLDAIFYSNCGIPHGGPYIISTEGINQEGGFNQEGRLNFAHDALKTDYKKHVLYAFADSLKNDRNGGDRKMFRYSPGNIASPGPSYQHYKLEDEQTKHRLCIDMYVPIPSRSLRDDMNYTWSAFFKAPNKNHGNRIKKDYTYAPVAGSYFYNPAIRTSGSAARTGHSLVTSANHSNHFNQQTSKFMVDPFMSFCGHGNLMSYRHILPQINRDFFTGKDELVHLDEESWKTRVASQLAVSKGFVTVAKVYSLAAHEEVAQSYLDHEDRHKPAAESFEVNAFLHEDKYIDRQFARLMSIELKSIHKNENSVSRVDLRDADQKIPYLTDFGALLYKSAGRAPINLSNHSKAHISHTTAIHPQAATVFHHPAKKHIKDNFPTRLNGLAKGYRSSAPAGWQEIRLGAETRNIASIIQTKANMSSMSNHYQSAEVTRGIWFRHAIDFVIRNHVAAKDEFGAWARMSCPAWLSGEIPHAEYLKNSLFFANQSDLPYSPLQALPNQIPTSNTERIYRWRDILTTPLATDSVPASSQDEDPIPRAQHDVRLGDYNRHAFANTATAGYKSANIIDTSLVNNERSTLKTIRKLTIDSAQRALIDDSTQLPPSVRENLRNLRESNLTADLEQLVYGAAGMPASEISIGLRLVKIMQRNSSLKWLGSRIANIENAEKAHVLERSLYINAQDKTLTNFFPENSLTKNILMHIPIVSSETPFCFSPTPDANGFTGDAEFRRFITDSLNMNSSMMRAALSSNYENIISSPRFKLLSDYIFPSMDAQAAAAIYSSMVLTSQGRMTNLLNPTKNAFLNLLNSLTNKQQDPVSGIWTAPPTLSNSEIANMLKNTGTGGNKVPCGGMPGFDLLGFLEAIWELILHIPASILTTLALLLDPGYRQMVQKFQSCSPKDEHIGSLDFGSVAGPTEYGWGIPRGELVKGTLDGSAKGGDFANMLYSFPSDLFMGLTFLPLPPFVFFNPSFGMAFVKLANYLLGSVGLGSGLGGGLSTPCFSEDMAGDAKADLLDGKNGYGHPLLIFGPLALLVNSVPFLRLPADDPREQEKMCKELKPPPEPGGPPPDLNSTINSDCGPTPTAARGGTPGGLPAGIPGAGSE